MNLGQFEAQGIMSVDSPVNDILIKETPRELTLKIKSIEHSGQLLFIALEKNKCSIYLLFYKKHFHDKISIVADYLLAYFLKLYGNNILSIFDLYFQDLAKDTTWVNNQSYYEDDLELYEAINNTVDLEWIEDVE